MWVFIIVLIAFIVIVALATNEKNKREMSTPVLDQNGNNTNVYDLKQKYKSQGIMFCPNCISTNVQYMDSKVVGQRDAKVKTTYKANLNPLKPFTLVNEKQKVVRKGSAGVSIQQWHCQNCGKIFEKR